MAEIKLTTWNIEHMRRVVGDDLDSAALERQQKIVEEIRAIDPDILCVVEASPDIVHMRDFAASALGGDYVLPAILGTDAALAQNPHDPPAALRQLYRMKGNVLTGSQWMWFLVKRGLADDAELLDPAVFDVLAGGPTWKVHRYGERRFRNHGHWRHPQVLVLELAGRRVDIIAAHMKSKLNTSRKRPFEDDGVTFTEDYLREALNDRYELATEAVHVRNYIEARFAQEPDPAIFVVGDLNDGPGKERFETEFLFFDLLSNMQGDVFFAKRFLNHALFDFEGDLRWSLMLDRADPVDPGRDRRILLDHILFTQRLVNDTTLPQVHSGAGLVEHTIHAMINAALPRSKRTSDHVPVSVAIEV